MRVAAVSAFSTTSRAFGTASLAGSNTRPERPAVWADNRKPTNIIAAIPILLPLARPLRIVHSRPNCSGRRGDGRRGSDWDSGSYSIVRFTLTREGEGTRLAVNHDAYPEGESPRYPSWHEHLSANWPVFYFDPFAKYLAG